MKIACVDLEGVLAPEMWPHIGKVAGISGLSLTTREEPDYLKLMAMRIHVLRQYKLKLNDVRRIVAQMPLLDGAADFLNQLKANYRVVIISDAFRELAEHFGSLLGSPEMQCHHFAIDSDGYIQSCVFLSRKGKDEAINIYRNQKYRTLAIGDAFNDLAMLRAADCGFLFRPSKQTLQFAAGIPVVQNYDEIMTALIEHKAMLVN